MNTAKVAITIPVDLVATIDNLCKKVGSSRSKFITDILREKIENTKKVIIKEAYNSVFSDPRIQEEQLETSRFFEGTGSAEGQEW